MNKEYKVNVEFDIDDIANIITIAVNNHSETSEIIQKLVKIGYAYYRYHTFLNDIKCDSDFEEFYQKQTTIKE